MLERFRLRSLSAKASANRADGTEGSSRAMRTENLNWQDMRPPWSVLKVINGLD
jgi:hypothetical protein